MTGIGHQRDPVSLLFDDPARRLLDRAYARPGVWAHTRLPPPPPHRVAQFAVQGINLLARDTLPGGAARTRWARAFLRAVVFQHKWFSPTPPSTAWRAERRLTARTTGAVVVEVGRWQPAAGVVPAGRAVRVVLLPGGQKMWRAKQAKPEAQQIFDNHGSPAGRWGDPALRDWA